MAKVLIIEDSSVSRQKLSASIRQLGHECIEAVSGEMGLELAKAEQPDCIFLDILMPGMDGYEVLARLKHQRNQSPVFVVTADIQETTRKKVIGLGAEDVIKKPPKASAIVEAISKACEAKKNEEDVRASE